MVTWNAMGYEAGTLKKLLKVSNNYKETLSNIELNVKF